MPDVRRQYCRLILIFCMLLTGACTTVGPEYVRSQPELPAAYHAAIPELFESGNPKGPWWSIFNDPVLNILVCRGFSENLDVQISLSRMREARELARGQVAATGPRLDGSVEARGQKQHQGNDEDDGNGTALFGILSGIWEVDLFGRLKRSREAAWARAGVEQALEVETRRLTAAEIVQQYVQMRAAERRLVLIRVSTALQAQTLDLVDSRVRAGLSPGLDLVRARAAVARLRAELGPLHTEIQRARNVLSVMLGMIPGSLDETLSTDDPQIPRSQTGRTVGIPTDLLRRRPDIQAAEYRIAATTADVGIATAELYPKLTLPGTIRVGWDGIVENSAMTTITSILSALLELPLYDGGEREAAIDVANERLLQETLNYRKQLLTAIQEVESALVGYSGARSTRDALAESVRNNRLAFEQSGELYRQGLASFLDVLDSQREWNVTLQELATAERDSSLEVVNLLSAVGFNSEQTGCVPELRNPSG